MSNRLIANIKCNCTSPFPTVTNEEAQTAEKELGVKLPPLLRDIYLNIGNGGIGPGYGILGIEGGQLTDEANTIVEHYKCMCMPDDEDSSWSWPRKLLPFCNWGCAIYSCISFSNDSYPILWFDPNRHEIGQPWDSAFIEHHTSLENWINAWLNGNDLFADLSELNT